MKQAIMLFNKGTGFPDGSEVKVSACNAGDLALFDPCVGKIPWRRKWQPTPVFLPGEFHGWTSLVGYSPRGRKESDTTERLHFTIREQRTKTYQRQIQTQLRNTKGLTEDRDNTF